MQLSLKKLSRLKKLINLISGKFYQIWIAFGSKMNQIIKPLTVKLNILWLKFLTGTKIDI